MNKITALLIFLLPIAAVGKTFVQTHIDTNSTFAVNQRVLVTLTLLTDEYFTQGPLFTLPTINHALVIQQEKNVVSSFSTFKGTKYTSQVITYDVYPSQVGVFTIPSIDVTTQVEGDNVTVQTQPYSIVVSNPPVMKGVDDLLVSNDVEVTDSWEGLNEHSKVGDIFTRNITIKAENSSRLVLPDFIPNKNDAVTVQQETAQLNDVFGRDTHYAEMQQQITYIVKEAGVHQLGAEKLYWWNNETQSKEVYTFEGVTIDAGFSLVQAIKTYWITLSIGIMFIVVFTFLFRRVANKIISTKRFLTANGLGWLSQLYRDKTKNTHDVVLFQSICNDKRLLDEVMGQSFEKGEKIPVTKKIRFFFKSNKIND